VTLLCRCTRPRRRADFRVPVEDLVEDIAYAHASPDDLPAVRALLQGCGLPTEDLRPGNLEHFVVCRLGERVIGTVGLEPLGEVALLRSLAVAQELRGRRLGHVLWARARDHALARGIRRLYLLTTTAESLFARWGFHRIPRDEVADVVRNTTEYSTMCPSTAAVMAMDLVAGGTGPDRPSRRL
jgi:amino-acid N-acetyltransferase